MMALGAVKEVVFLQPDPGQKSIGEILFKLNGKDSAFSAPRPIPANMIGLVEYDQLEEAFNNFVDNVGTNPFHTLGKKLDMSPSITSFLCTKDALNVFKNGRKKMNTLNLKYPTWRPTKKRTTLTNDEVLKHVQFFHKGAVAQGRRATPTR